MRSNEGPTFRSWVSDKCRQMYGELPSAWESLAPDGSDRRFFRIQIGERTLIGLCYPEGRPGGTGENDAYVAIGRHLEAHGVRAPKIHDYCREKGWSLIEDAGNLSLQQAAMSVSDGSVFQRASVEATADGGSISPPSGEILSLYEPVLDLLLDLQLRAREGFQDAWCYQGARYDQKLMVERESGYFLRAFLKGYLGWEVEEGPVMEEFAKLASLASAAPGSFLLHRDFQSRNILLPSRDRPCVIDFQGARWGPLQYDVASLVLDPYVPMTTRMRGQILQSYLDKLDAFGMGPEAFMAHYPIIALHRSLQILGAFAFLGRVKGKAFFLQWIPRALNHLHGLMLSHEEWDCPILRKWVDKAWEKIGLGDED